MRSTSSLNTSAGSRRPSKTLILPPFQPGRPDGRGPRLLALLYNKHDRVVNDANPPPSDLLRTPIPPGRLPLPPRCATIKGPDPCVALPADIISGSRRQTGTVRQVCLIQRTPGPHLSSPIAAYGPGAYINRNRLAVE